MALMDKARAASGPTQGDSFTKPDIAQFVPPGMTDQVDRIVAAGMKMMYSPDMRDEMMGAIDSEDPTAKKLAENVVGLMLALDQKAQGGMPVEAIFPAAIGLLGEAAGVLVAAKQPVSQEDFNEAARMVFVMMGKQMGASDDDIMGAAQQHIGGGDDEDAAHEAMPGDEQDDAAAGEPPDPPQQTMPPQQPMRRGM